MPRLYDDADIQELWTDWQKRAASRATEPATVVLRDILRARGTALSSEEITFALGGADLPGASDLARFADCMVALLGDADLRLKHAFAAFDADADGTIATAEFRKVVQAFCDDPAEADLLCDEIDTDGDGRLSLGDLTRYLAVAPFGSGGYRASHLGDHHIGAGFRPALSVAQTVAPDGGQDADAGLSPLDLRIGFFRLMQGAAYRSFRENYSANSETHLRARDLPYTITDFARFTTATIDYYLSLGVITDPECIAEFEMLDRLVQDELERLQSRIRCWPDVEKTPEMVAAQATLAAERDAMTQRRDLCRAVVEFVLSLRLHGLGVDQDGADALTQHEINRLRHSELRAEMHRAPAPQNDPDGPYIARWTRVVLSAADERIDGAIMPVRFWYESFMPQLLRCASVTTAQDLQALRALTETDLDWWHADLAGRGAFDRYATDLRDGFAHCPPETKLALYQAWTLTAPYLLGVEKRREREEFGRDSGFLSEYVAFVDVHLGRRDVATADMRLSFPYYIGPAVWGLLHGSAELVEAMPEAPRAVAIDRFADFFRAFATMYPCPYCRYHLNRYVIRNREVDMYPIEFLLLGRPAGQHDTAISLDDKLATISAPGGLRGFLWKLHNAVSSSIARTEPWYHRQPRPLYTTRFWPGIEAELARAASSGNALVPVARMNEIYRITKPAAHLAVLRDALGRAIRAGDAARVSETMDRADEAIHEITQAMEDTGYLTHTYAYDPDKGAGPADFDATQEAFARSGVFIER